MGGIHTIHFQFVGEFSIVIVILIVGNNHYAWVWGYVDILRTAHFGNTLDAYRVLFGRSRNQNRNL